MKAYIAELRGARELAGTLVFWFTGYLCESTVCLLLLEGAVMRDGLCYRRRCLGVFYVILVHVDVF